MAWWGTFSGLGATRRRTPAAAPAPRPLALTVPPPGWASIAAPGYLPSSSIRAARVSIIYGVGNFNPTTNPPPAPQPVNPWQTRDPLAPTVINPWQTRDPLARAVK